MTTQVSVATWLLAALFVAAGASLWDLHAAQTRTLVIYTTSALRDVLEKDVVPRFEKATGDKVALIYVPAGEQYNRLRMSGANPEADLFLHASPLYLEEGYHEGHVTPTRLAQDGSIGASLKSRDVGGGARAWYAFAWSPLVEVYAPRLRAAPDLATTDAKVGLAHPLLSNNGAYAALLLDNATSDHGANALARTRVQPVNARATIGGIADGSFDVTLGYEAVARYYAAQGADVRWDVPLVAGQRVTTPVLFTAAVINGHHHPDAERLLQFLFTNETQDALAAFELRPALPGHAEPSGAIDITSEGRATTLVIDWSRWSQIESTLVRYEVRS